MIYWKKDDLISQILRGEVELPSAPIRDEPDGLITIDDPTPTGPLSDATLAWLRSLAPPSKATPETLTREEKS